MDNFVIVEHHLVDQILNVIILVMVMMVMMMVMMMVGKSNDG